MSKIIKSLFKKSFFVQKKIDEENSSKYKNWIKLLKLKKIRLKIKDKIFSLLRKSFQPSTSKYKALPAYVKVDSK